MRNLKSPALLLVGFGIISVLLTGCASMSNRVESQRLAKFKPETDAEYKVVGSTKGKAEGAVLLGVFNVGAAHGHKTGDLVFGETSWRPRGNILSTIISTIIPISSPTERIRRAAIFNAIEKIPEADLLVAPRYRMETNSFLPFFVSGTVYVKAKAIRIASGTEDKSTENEFPEIEQ